MYKYRLAVPNDLEELMRMTEAFYAAQKDSVEIPYDSDSTTLSMLDMIDNGLVVVVYPAEEEAADGEIISEQPIVGAMAFSYFRPSINIHVKCAKEQMFWIDPDHRDKHIAHTMLLVCQIGLKADDVQYSYMSALSNSPEAATYLYAKMGYTEVERSFIKEL